MANDDQRRQMILYSDNAKHAYPELFAFVSLHGPFPQETADKFGAAVENFYKVSKNLAGLAISHHAGVPWLRKDIRYERLPQVSHYEESLSEIFSSLSGDPRSRHLKAKLSNVLAVTVQKDLEVMQINCENIERIKTRLENSLGLNI